MCVTGRICKFGILSNAWLFYKIEQIAQNTIYYEYSLKLNIVGYYLGFTYKTWVSYKVPGRIV